jgi:hypothetical protein
LYCTHASLATIAFASPWSMPAHGPAGAVTTSLHAWELDRPGPGEMWCEEAASQAPAADAGASKRQGVIVVALPMPMNISRRTAACYSLQGSGGGGGPLGNAADTEPRRLGSAHSNFHARGHAKACGVAPLRGCGWLWPDRQRRAQLKSERKQ